MAKRSKEQILADKLKSLKNKREYRINRYIVPVEIEMEQVREQIKALIS